MSSKPLSEYNRKRDFSLTAEPPGTGAGKKAKTAQALSFVIQKHDARRLHYDFRLELNGTLKSWAIPKGPSLDPKDKRLAVHVEDHPLSYADFEGSIPQGQYGGGDVIVWDHGIWQPQDDPAAAYKAGKLKFTLIGEKLSGDWTLVRTHLQNSGDKEQWLLIKERDESARPADEYNIVEAQPQSVISGALIAGKAAKKSTNKSSADTAQSVNSQSSPAAKEAQKKATGKSSDSTTKKGASEKKSESPPARRAKKTPLPEMLTPELATLVSEPPPGNWAYEIKFDGYRILTRIQNGKVRLFTRNGNDWTDRMPLQADAIAALGIDDSWLDGEVVVLDEKGLPNFQALQNAFDIGKSQDIIYFLFDAPFLQGEDIRDLPVEERRAALEKIISDSPNKESLDKEALKKEPANKLVRFSAAFNEGHQSILASACQMELEGVIGKRLGSPYVSHRSGDWIKLKCRLRQEFVIVGYTQPKGSRSGFGALLVAVHDQLGKPDLRYAGRVGTGFNDAGLKELSAKLQKLHIKDSPLSHKLNSTQARGVQWIQPKLVCELEFAQWTSEGILRQAAFIAMRTDKPARDIIRERPKAPDELPPPEMTGDHMTQSTATNENTSVKISKKTQALLARITHPDRVIDPQSGATKKQLAEFYASVSDWILPHLNDRPVSIVRAPDGITGQQFFQKHAEKLSIPNIHHLDKSLDPGHPSLMEIDNVEALVGAVQMGTIELHTWGSKSENIDLPDRVTLDLDPDPALPWRSLVEATRLTLAVLEELGLDAFLKTTGGKGMHIVVPLAAKADWDTVKEFSKSIAQFMANQIPDRFVAKMGPQNRVGKIFIDYLRNQRGASTVCAFSVRARPGLPVSVPITRDELLELKGSAEWNIFNLQERLEALKEDPWKGYKNRQQITQAMWKKLAITR